MSIFNGLSATGKTVVMVTHNNKYEKYSGKIIKLVDGEII